MNTSNSSSFFDRPRPPGRVLVLRALQLGDLLCSVPALRALRRAWPKAEIALVGLAEAKTFVERFGAYLDELIVLPGFPGLVEQPAHTEALPAFLETVQRRQFDLALQLHGSGSITNILVELFGAGQTAGFYLPGAYCPDERTFFSYPEHEPEVRRPLQLLSALGLPLAGEELEFPLLADDRRAAARLMATLGLEPGRYVCVHAGARDPKRRWPSRFFAQVADWLAALGLAIVLTGTGEEASLTGAVARQMHYPAFNLAGQTTLATLAALLESARLLVSNDTGISHLAACLAVPSVVIFSASDPARWAPLDRERHRVVLPGADPAVVVAQGELLLEREWRTNAA
ncbi:glycosyltransferase family 9 protein [Gloeobacter kilaueensis]|nr:glycosyltransferase family 9 protein [Gloeobacter kilaueensis]